MASCRSTQRHLTDSTPNTTSRPDRLTVASALSRTSSMQTASWRHRCGVRHLHIDICLVVALMSSFVPRFSFTRILLQNLPPPNRNALCLGIDVGLRASPPELELSSMTDVVLALILSNADGKRSRHARAPQPVVSGHPAHRIRPGALLDGMCTLSRRYCEFCPHSLGYLST